MSFGTLVRLCSMISPRPVVHPLRRAAIGPRRSVAWSLIFLFTFSSGLLLVGPSGRADTTMTMSPILSERYGASAVWDGTNAYIFGGRGSEPQLDKIVRYNPTTNTLTTMSTTLPTGRFHTSAAWVGTNAYIFGGLDCCVLNQIVRYNPTTNTVTTMSATLPTGRWSTSAVSDGTNVYIFGGSEGGSYPNQILRYNPPTDTLTVMSATLPSGRSDPSAVWDGTYIYIFGGFNAGSKLNDIVRYNPTTNTVTTMSATLPTGRYATSAVWDGTNAYIFGGSDSSGPLNEIVRYNPATNTVTTMRATLPTTRLWTSAVWTGTNPYIFSGLEAGLFNGIVRYDPNNPAMPPTAPSSLVATQGPGAGEISLNWQAPADSGSSSVTNFRIYRATTNTGTYTKIAQTGNVLSFTDTGRPAGTTWYYRVAAVNIAGEGLRSGTASATTFNKPSVPGNLTAEVGPELGQITLEWEAPLSNGGMPITNYRVYRDSGSGEAYLAQVGNVLTYTDNTCGSPGRVCYYTVSAVNGAGESPHSNRAFAPGTTPAAPAVVIAAYDFESGPQGWWNDGYPYEWEWGTPTYGPPGAHSGVSAWGTDLDGTYENYADESLYSPYIHLPSTSPVLLSWWHYFNSASNDVGYVDISENGGPWTTLAIFTGPVSPAWAQQTVDVSAYAGSVIEVRYRFVSDSILVDAGWYVDDVSLWTPNP